MTKINHKYRKKGASKPKISYRTKKVLYLVADIVFCLLMVLLLVSVAWFFDQLWLTVLIYGGIVFAIVGGLLLYYIRHIRA